MACRPRGQGAEADLSCGLERSSPVLEEGKGSMVPEGGSRFQRETPGVTREAHVPSMARKQQRTV